MAERPWLHKDNEGVRRQGSYHVTCTETLTLSTRPSAVDEASRGEARTCTGWKYPGLAASAAATVGEDDSDDADWISGDVWSVDVGDVRFAGDVRFSCDA